MFKKELGISVYPEKSDYETIIKYLKTAQKYGFKKLFMSWFQLSRDATNLEKNQELYKKVIQEAKELGYYVVLDIHDNKFEFYQLLGVNCVRLDAPSWPFEVSLYTQQEPNLDFQLNMSGDSNYLDSVLMCDTVVENIYGCHNFYPQINTGLTMNDFLKWTKHFHDLGIHTSTFINSQNGEDGPQNFKLKYGVVTVEKLRFLPIRTQAKLMFANKLINDVYIGNQFASDDELKSLSEIDKNKIELDIEIVNRELQPLEKEILLKNQHRRGDINKNFIRSSEHRVTYASREDIIEIQNNHLFKKGDVVINNNSDKNYQKELLLVLREVTIPNAQLIAKVKNYDFGLIDFITASRWFKFKIID